MIRTLWQVDFEEWGPEWLIVAPGPTLDDPAALRPFLHLPAVAVDGAAAHPELVPAVWACWEPPRPIHALCLDRCRATRPAVVTRWDACEEWHNLLEDRVSTPARPLDPLVVGQHPRHDPIPQTWRTPRLDRAPSWLLALRLIVFRAQARTVHLVGFDLAGDGYGLELPDDRGRDSLEWEGRWRGERKMLAAALALCRARGVHVRRHGRRPRPEVPRVDPGRFWEG